MSKPIVMLFFACLHLYIIESSSDSEDWKAYVYSCRRQGCAPLIPSDVQEAMNKSQGIIPFRFLYACLFDNYIKDISPWLDPTKQYNMKGQFSG